VRICLTRDLKFQECPEIDRRACRRDKVVMPPVRKSEARATNVNAQATAE
jgi:ribonuclease T2